MREYLPYRSSYAYNTYNPYYPYYLIISHYHLHLGESVSVEFTYIKSVMSANLCLVSCGNLKSADADTAW